MGQAIQTTLQNNTRGLKDSVRKRQLWYNTQTMLKDLYTKEVLPLLKSQVFRCICGFFLVLAYGYYLMNPAVCHDWMNPWSDLGWRTSLVTSYMMRWGYGLMALELIHDVERNHPAVSEKPLVIVGCAAVDAWKYGAPDGVAWLGQKNARQTAIEKRLGWRYLSGGYVGQTTMLDAGRLDELYYFLSKIGRRRYQMPNAKQMSAAEDEVLKRHTPGYPAKGSVFETESAIIVNLGLTEKSKSPVGS